MLKQVNSVVELENERQLRVGEKRIEMGLR